MSKIKVKSRISKANGHIIEIKTDALKNDNKIMFYEDNNTLMKVEFKKDLVYIVRDNAEMKLEMSFQSNRSLQGLYKIKSLNSNMDIKITTKDLIIKNNKIKIVYDMYMSDEYNDTFTYKLEWSD